MAYITPALILKRDVSAEDVARAMIEEGHQKQPFHVFDMDEVYQRIQRFKRLLPRVDIFYAMKSNDNEMMLKLAIAMGVGFDCASPGEIAKIKQLNVSPRSIIYAMTSKASYQMSYAQSASVMHTTFDSAYELKKIKLYWPDARLLLRVRVDSHSVYELGKKFGCDFDTEAIELLKEAARLGLNVSQLINGALEDLFPDPEVQIIAEPGRYLCDTSFILYCNVSNLSTVKMDNKEINVVHMNDGRYGTLSYFESWYNVENFQKTSDSKTEIPTETILIGPTKDPRDSLSLSRKMMLPKLKIDDWLVVKRQGAYTFTMSKAFISLERPQIRTVISLKLWNKIKNSPAFATNDFVINCDMSTPLPSTLPPVLQRDDILQ